MVNHIKYTDEMVAEALAMRARGEKQAVIHLTYGEGIESASRAGIGSRVELPLPKGTAAALERVCEAAGDAPVALLSQQIHKLDQLLAGDRAAFDVWVRYGNNVAGVAARHIERIGADCDE